MSQQMTRREERKPTRWTAASWPKVSEAERSKAYMFLVDRKWKIVALSELDKVWSRNRRAVRTRSSLSCISTGSKYRKNWQTETGPNVSLIGLKTSGWNVPAAILH